MEYRTLGRTGRRISAIGLGMEHLNPEGGENVVPVVRRAIEAGITYFDVLLWVPAAVERFGEAIAGHRDDLTLAIHLGAVEQNGQYRKTRDVAESEEAFEAALQRIAVDRADVLLITYVDEPSEWEAVVEPGGVLDLALRLKAEGKARYLGLSGHNAAVMLTAIETGHIDAVMYPINVTSNTSRGTRELVATCQQRGVGLLGMKPFAGGELLKGERRVSSVKCLAYGLDLPELSAAVMGVKSVVELEENLSILTASEEERDYQAALEAFRDGIEGQCLFCQHCLPCTVEIDIPEVMRLLNAVEWGAYSSDLQASYEALPVSALDCVACGTCEDRCPFGVPVMSRVARSAEVFEGTESS